MDKQLDVLFLGRLFPKQKGPAIRQKASVDMQDAANVLQWNIIYELWKGYHEQQIEAGLDQGR